MLSQPLCRCIDASLPALKGEQTYILYPAVLVTPSVTPAASKPQTNTSSCHSTSSDDTSRFSFDMAASRSTDSHVL